MEMFLFLEQIQQLRQAVFEDTVCAQCLGLSQGIVLLCGDTAGLALTFGHEGFQPS